MKVTNQLDRLEPMILGPIKSVEGENWHRAPDGNWSLAQIVGHIAIGVDLVATSFEKLGEKKSRERRATPEQSLMRHLILGVGEMPEDQEHPHIVEPPERPDPEAVQAQFRMGVERTGQLVSEWPQEKQESVWVAHPLFGDFNLPEWVRFHFVHCRHHAAQIERRLKWLDDLN